MLQLVKARAWEDSAILYTSSDSPGQMLLTSSHVLIRAAKRLRDRVYQSLGQSFLPWEAPVDSHLRVIIKQ